MSEITNKTLENEHYAKYLNGIGNKTLREFAVSCVKEYGTREKLEEANEVIKVMLAYYEEKGLMKGDPYFIDLMKVAAFIHNLFTNDSWISVYTAREQLQQRALDAGISYEYVIPLFAIVEGQLGDKMPVPGSRPSPNHPVNDFALFCWIVKKLLPYMKETS